MLFRAAQRLGITVEEANARLSVEDIFDEADLGAYLRDVDDPPKGAQPPPAPSQAEAVLARYRPAKP